MEDSKEETVVTLTERLDKIKSPKLQNQRETAVVLSAVEETLKDQKHEFTPTAYFAALLALLGQTGVAGKALVNKDLATSVLYLLDIITTYVPAPLLRARFSQVFGGIDLAIKYEEAEAPMLRSCTGCLESLLIAQDAAAWALPQGQLGPRWGVARILALSMDHRPKVRKRALDALLKILQNQPPSPSLDHPAADMCATTALERLERHVKTAQKTNSVADGGENSPGLIHTMHLIKTISQASGGWPSKHIDSLCELLLEVAKSNNKYLVMTSFEIFEVVFSCLAHGNSTAKLPRLLEAISDLRPSQNDSQLLPPWIAVLARAYDVSAQIEPEETFLKLPEVFAMISEFLTSMSFNIRGSASECLVSLASTCIPSSVILEPSVFDEKTLEKFAKVASGLVSIKYQAAWKEVFNVLSALFETLKWRSSPYLNEIVLAVGDLRSNESFNGKKEADVVLGSAVEAIGPDNLLKILPLNLVNPKPDQPGRAWMLPILRDNTINTSIAHFKSEFIPLSDAMEKRVEALSKGGKAMETKIFETLVSQIWSLLPGYFTLPVDLRESFDEATAQLASTKLYEKPELRVDICKALQTLVECNKEIAALAEDEEDLLAQRRITIKEARANIEHLSRFSSSFLAVLFNIYSRTLPHLRGYILQCINAFLGIIPAPELEAAFSEVVKQLEAELAKEGPQTQADKQEAGGSADKMPPTSHALMDLVITMAIHLPQTSFPTLLRISQVILPKEADPQLQKKAYKLIPRLSSSETGAKMLREQNTELQSILLSAGPTTAVASRRDRLAALFVLISYMPSETLHFIPAILSEVIICAKEINEKARTAAFDLLVLMGHKMAAGGLIDRSKIPNMEDESGHAEASLEEYVTMLSVGLAGTAPHMIAASVTALARVLHEFHDQLSETLLNDLSDVMADLLGHSAREVVKAVLGWQKVAALELPEAMVRARLPTLVPALLAWSHEQKGRLRVKVKGIVERLIRRFGFDDVNAHAPEADRKLLVNVRKRKERAKRRKDAAKADDASSQAGSQQKPRAAFASELDNALYDSDASSAATGSDDDDENASDSDQLAAGDGRQRQRHGRGAVAPGKPTARARHDAYIMDDADEPLDLLDRRALGRISSSQPVRARAATRRHAARTDEDGRLVFGEDESGQAGVDGADGMDLDGGGGRQSGAGGVGAYVDAIRGRDAARRGRGGRLKFSNRPGRGGDEMDLDDDGDGVAAAKQQQQQQQQQQMRKVPMKHKARSGAPLRRGLGERKAGDGGVGAGRTGGGRGVAKGRVAKQVGGRGVVQRGRRGRR